MIPGLGLASKVVGFVLELIIRNQVRRDELKKSFQEFVTATAKDTQVATDLHEDYKNMKGEPWTENESSDELNDKKNKGSSIT